MNPDIRQAVHDAVVALFVAVDERDWPRARAAFTETVRFDMSSMTGDPEVDTPAADIVAGWADGLESLDGIHHQVSNFRFEIGEGVATVRCYGIAYHYLEAAEEGTTRTFVGTYTFGLLETDGGWKVQALRFELKFIDGNADLEGRGG